MDNEQLPFGYSHSHRPKRTHAEMESDGSLSPLWGSVNVNSRARSPSGPTTSDIHISPQVLPQTSSILPQRYIGDGMDYRRPMSLSRSNNNTPIIDLTTDDAGPQTSETTHPLAMEANSTRASRPPRFAREIIDVEAEPDRPDPESPEIEFVSARTVQPPRQPALLEIGNDEDLEIVSVNEIPEERRRADFGEIRGFVQQDLQGIEHLRRAILARAERIRPIIQPQRDSRRPGARAGGRPRGHRGHIEFEVPVNMDFAMVGFNMGLGGGVPEPPPPPTYEPPEPAPVGFTRSPTEDDVLVCPNCGDELCTGDTDVKRQVWILKACGHVYCGECATNRHASSRKKGKEKAIPGRAKPFKVCAVEECDKKTISTKAMIQVFL